MKLKELWFCYSDLVLTILFAFNKETYISDKQGRVKAAPLPSKIRRSGFFYLQVYYPEPFRKANNDTKLYNLSNVIIKLSKQYAKSSSESTTDQDPQYPYPELDRLQQTCTEYSEVPKQKNTM